MQDYILLEIKKRREEKHNSSRFNVERGLMIRHLQKNQQRVYQFHPEQG